MEKRKSQKRPTQAQPFKFNEKKRDPNARSFMDEEPPKQTDMFTKLIADKARKAAQNSNINPATTAKATAAAKKRREEIENNRKMDEDLKV